MNAPSELAPLWEVAKGVMLTLITLGVGWLVRTVFDMRDQVRSLTNEVCNEKGGLKITVATLVSRVGLIEDRNLVIDAVAKIEKEGYEGDERRHGLRAIQDMIHSEIDAALRQRGTPNA